MVGVNFAGGKAFVISHSTGFVYVYNMETLRPAGRIKIGTNVNQETATTDTADQKLYLADSTELGGHWRGIFDDQGRIMVAISFNSDMGNAWEWADDASYPKKFSGLAIRTGVNYVVYAMTH